MVSGAYAERADAADRAETFDEQRRIVAQVEEQLSAIDALRAAIERAQRRSASLRRAVLERAFRGELVPQDPSDEPASVLLERIARRAGHESRTEPAEHASGATRPNGRFRRARRKVPSKRRRRQP